MPDKRKLPVADYSPAKRSRPFYLHDDHAGEMTSATVYERPRNHPVYGQKSAFPGLDAACEGELFYGPAEDGIEYLRMVRSEANSLPFVLTASKPQDGKSHEAEDQKNRSGDYDGERGVVADGVYTAATSIGLQVGELGQKSYPSAQVSYYNLLRHRFILLRSTLKCTPPITSISALDESHPISFPRRSVAAKKEWRRLLLAVDPHMAQLACMDMDSVLGVLRIMGRLMSENFRTGDMEKVRRIAAWAWGLLGRCREVGQLGTEDVGDIRDLGKRAVRILGKIKEGEGSRSNAEDVESSGSEDEQMDLDNTSTESRVADEPDADMAILEELEAAKMRLQAKLQADDQDITAKSKKETEDQRQTVEVSDLARQTHAMLDMIITVVGEFYGQRDLLEAREIWGFD